MIHKVEKNGKFYVVETGYGFNTARSTVHCYNRVDQFGRLIDGECIYMGDWDDCMKFVESL